MTERANDNAGIDWSTVSSALLIRLRSIGDTALMTPCLAALKSFRPDIEITVLIEPLAAPLLEGHPMVDRLLVVEKSFASRSRIIRRLRSEHYDVAFNMHGGSTATMIARMSGASHTIGYRGHPKSWMLTKRAPAPDVILGRARVHSVEQQLALLKWAGVPWPSSRPSLHLNVDSDAEASVREKLRASGLEPGAFAVVAPAAAFESKRWRADGFAQVIDHLSTRWDLPAVVIAGPGQESIATEAAAAAHSSPVVITGLSLKELIALLKLARAFVGNDSGPMHIAAAFNRPIVAVFGSSDQSVWHPWTESPYAVVRTEVGGRESAIRAQEEVDYNSRGDIKQIPARDVIAVVDEVLEMALRANHTAGTSFQSEIAK